MNIIASQTTHKPSHLQKRKPGLAIVQHGKNDYPIDENSNLMEELENMVALNNRDEVFAIAKWMIHQGEPSLMPYVPQLVSVDEIAMKFGLCTRSIWRLVGAEELPQPITMATQGYRGTSLII